MRIGDDGVTTDLFNNTLIILCAIFATSVCGYLIARPHLSIGLGAVAAAAILLLIIFALVIHALPNHCHGRFGYANAVTAFRSAIVSIIGATVFFAGNMQGFEPVIWHLIALALIALMLDAIDGHLARRFRQESALGARFDMEVDALLLLILSAAGLMLGKAGWWVILIGSMRYGFVLAQYALPRLRAPLPTSFRRKLVCVVQGVALCIILAPVVAPPASALIAAVALALLGCSFMIDTVYLLRRRASAE